jgi:3-deoxy-D-manno-octulosonic-acid transferase
MMMALYRIATKVGWPLIRLYLSWRKKRGKEDPERFSERLGIPGAKRPEGFVIWFHGASVGEAVSMLPLIERLSTLRPDIFLLVTTGTVTSARLLGERLPDGVRHQYIPVDHTACVRRFLDYWRPSLALWAESEFWPNLLCQSKERNIPMILINGRVSERSYSRWRKFPGFASQLLSGFSLCLGQTETDAKRLERLGAKKVLCHGNLKFAAPDLPVDTQALAALRAETEDRPVWLAASTHPGEEEIACTVHQQLKENLPSLLTIIVPRHPERGYYISKAICAMGLSCAKRSANDPISEKTDIYLADTMGELGLFYRLSGISFIGKSLASKGGQNPLEAARLGSALICGPHMTNFEDITRRLKEAEAFLEVPDANALKNAVKLLLCDEDKRYAQAEAGRKLAEAETGAVERIMKELAPYLEALATTADKDRARA